VQGGLAFAYVAGAKYIHPAAIAGVIHGKEVIGVHALLL
jgi:hypothetical protein